MVRLAATAVLAALLTAHPLAQRDPRTALLERAAWEALSSGRTTSAAAAFDEALKSDPTNPRLHLGAGLAAFLERRDEFATQELTRALALDDSLIDAHKALAQIAYRSGDALRAVREQKTVVAAEPGNAEARAALERWEHEADLQAGMEVTGDPRFTVSFEGTTQADVARAVLDALDRAYWRVGAALGVHPVRPVPVVLYTSQQFTDVTRSPSWAAGAYDGIVRLPVGGALDQLDELDRVVAHEFTHAVVRDLAPRGVPVWLNEGLASALEREGVDWSARVAQLGGRVSVEALPASFARLSGDEARRAYAVSALATERLLELGGGAGVTNLLRDLGAGVDFEVAFKRRIYVSFPDFLAGFTR
jgi:tetratricopeptide (TPR) repeat protein